jgi:hypothetical protein
MFASLTKTLTRSSERFAGEAATPGYGATAW